MKYAATVVLLLLLCLAGCSKPVTEAKSTPAAPTTTPTPEKPETPHLEFVTEYVRELGALSAVREIGEREMKQPKQDPIMAGIYSLSRFQMELKSQVRILGDMNLKPPFDSLIPNITSLRQQQIEVLQQLIDGQSAFVGGPKSGVDYQKIAAEGPKLRAQMDDIDATLAKAAPAIFSSLIDLREDSKGHASHLIITRAERDKLVADIDAGFGKKLYQHNPTYLAMSAYVLKVGLTKKGFKCADEPWE
jgi:hypothetical protein